MELSTKKKRELLWFAHSSTNQALELELRIKVFKNYYTVFGYDFQTTLSHIKNLLNDEKLWTGYQSFNRIMRENVGVIGAKSINFTPEQIKKFREDIITFLKEANLWE